MPAADFCISMPCVLGCKPIAALGGVLEPQGPTGAADLKIMYNALAIVLPRSSPRSLSRGGFVSRTPERNIGPTGSIGLGDSYPRHRVSRWRDLERLK
jgi:hypothetical protein